MIVKSKFPAWKTKRGGWSIKYGPRLTQFVVVAGARSCRPFSSSSSSPSLDSCKGPLNIRGTRTAAAIRVPRALYVLTPNENATRLIRIEISMDRGPVGFQVDTRQVVNPFLSNLDLARCGDNYLFMFDVF